MPVFRLGQNWDPLRDLEREVDRLLRDVNLQFQGVRVGHRYPLLNLYEFDDRYVLTAEIPGTSLDGLDVSVADGMLTLRGERDVSDDVPDEAYRRQERFRGKWQRTVTLPERIQQDDLRAELAHGVLTVTLPRASDVQPRQIQVVNGGD